MSNITTHVLDLTLGHPGRGIEVALAKADDTGWQPLGTATTDHDGRVGDFGAPESALGAGRYRLTFDLDPYFADHGREAFFPRATLEFAVADDEHYHVPLLLSAYGYSTYRGS